MGYGSNPTLSNIVTYNGQSCAVVSWVEMNASGYAELHLQSIRVFTGAGYTPHPVWYGFGGETERSSTNHRVFGGNPAVPCPRADARPVLHLSLSGGSLTLDELFERSGSGICRTIEYINLAAGQDLGTGTFDVLSPVTVSSNAADCCPVFIKYPAVLGYPALLHVYYLGAGFDYSGLRVVECDGYGANKTALAKGYTESTYSSLQGAVNEQSASYVLVAQGDATNGHLVNLYTKLTYGSAPTLTRAYLNLWRPTVMLENVFAFGAPTSTLIFKGTQDDIWYQSPGLSGSLSSIGTSAHGFFLREQTQSNDKVSMVCRTTVTPSRLEIYGGSGGLGKTGDPTVPITRKEVRFWKDAVASSTRRAVLDVSGMECHVVDSLERGSTLCALAIDRMEGTGILAAQVDSLKTEFGVDLTRDGSMVRSFEATGWSALTSANLGSARAGDVVGIRLPGKAVDPWGYEEVAVRGGAVAKEAVAGGAESLVPLRGMLVAYPNPFNPSTTIRYTLPAESHVSLAIYDILGREVTVLVNGMVAAGYQSAVWNAHNVASGIYFARLVVTDALGKSIFSRTSNLMLAK